MRSLTVAGAAQFRALVHMNARSASRLTARTVDKRARAPECAQFMSGLEVRQDRLMRSLSVSVKCRLLSDGRVLFRHTVGKSLHKATLLRLETRQLSEPPNIPR